MPDTIILKVPPIHTYRNITHSVSHKIDNSKISYKEYDDYIVTIYSQNYDEYIEMYKDNLPVTLNLSEITPLYSIITCNVTNIRIIDRSSYYEIILNLRKVEE